jgi:hypothetical protein
MAPDSEEQRHAELARAEAGLVPRPLTDADLDAIEAASVRPWVHTTPDVLRLVAEVRGLRARVRTLQKLLDGE